VVTTAYNTRPLRLTLRAHYGSHYVLTTAYTTCSLRLARRAHYGLHYVLTTYSLRLTLRAHYGLHNVLTTVYTTRSLRLTDADLAAVSIMLEAVGAVHSARRVGCWTETVARLTSVRRDTM